MNSSGIKRGLAASAISALAVAGLPLIATSASASETALTVANVGPVRDGNAAGGTVVFSVPEGTTVNDAQVKLIRTDLSGTAGNQNTPTQTVAKVGAIAPTAEGSEVYGSKTGTDEFAAQISVDTNPTGETASFAVFIDSNGNNAVDASELRTPVSITTSGAPAIVEVTPDSRTTATGVQSAPYTVTAKDSAGRLTQLIGTEAFTATGTDGATTTGTLDATTMDDGVATFTATAPASSGGTKTLTVAGTGGIPNTVRDTATLVVLEQAAITADEFDIATGADTWSSTSTFGSTDTQIRVDQSSITFNFVSKDGGDADTIPDDAGRVVLFTLSNVAGSNLRFGGEATRQYEVVLDAEGKGSLTVTPTGIVAGSQFEFSAPGIAATRVTFARATATTVAPDSNVYVTQVGSPTAVTVTVKDQFGNPIGAPAQVQIVRDGARNTGTTARVTVNDAGQATFNLPDAGTAPGTEVFTINLFDDQFDGSATNVAGGTINYTADGRGADFAVAGIAENAALTTITPLYDSNAGAGDSAQVTITGATPGTPATITVDNGALVLASGETNLTQGSASDTITLAGGTGTFRVVGTKTGVVTVTIANAGRTETYRLTVAQSTVASERIATARNVELEGPESANAGSVAVFTATVTDAFGNPVAGVPVSSLQTQISGPGSVQSTDGATDANGELKVNVLLTDNANSTVTLRVTGVANGTTPQFGASAGRVAPADAANSAPGLPASSNTDSVAVSDIVNIAELEQAVADAEEAVARAEANLADAEADLVAAQGDLDVATAQLAVAQANVDRLTERKQNLREKLNRAKENGNRQKAKTTRKKLRATKRDLAAAQDALTIAAATVSSRQAVVERREAAVERAEVVLANAQEDLAEAEAALEEAQN